MRRRGLETAVALAFLTLVSGAAFWPILSNGFIFYDDDLYVTANEHVGRGLTWSGVRWALTAGHATNWHPLTWVSHMTDISLFGLNPAGHHAVSLLFHVANTLLLFLLLRRMTRTLWRSAAVAALFAVHPAHVESVAWAAERKDVLSAFFWLVAMWAYVSYVQRPSAGRYALVLVSFAAGLMSKPMVVTLPLVLLLIDYWPLGRFAEEEEGSGLLAPWRGGRLRVVLEKAPLFLMSAAAAGVTFLVQRAGGAVQSLEIFPPGVRLANAFVAFLRYIEKLLWPSRLSVFYPHPGRSLRFAEIAAAVVLIAALLAMAIRFRRRAPYLFVGLGWFLVTLSPVIGLVQVGTQAMADRYTYVPSIGFFIAIVWGAADLAQRWRYGAPVLRIALPASLAALTVAAAAQARLWKNSETLFLHAIAVTQDNYPARLNLGNYYNESGRPRDALAQLAEAFRLRPKDAAVHVDIGHALFLLGRLDDAVREFSEAMRLAPNDPVPPNDLGSTRLLQGEIEQARDAYRAAVLRAPDVPEYRVKLAMMLLMLGETGEAREHLERAVLLAPHSREYRQLLGGSSGSGPLSKEMSRRLAVSHRDAALALNRRGRKAEAIAHLRKALELAPTFWEARCDLGGLLAETGEQEAAAAELREALRINPKAAVAHNDLGYILFLQGNLEAAIEEYRAALEIQPDLALARDNLENALRRRAERERRAGPLGVLTR